MSGGLKAHLASVKDHEQHIIERVKDELLNAALDKEVWQRTEAIIKAKSVFKDIQGRCKNLEKKDIEFYDAECNVVASYYSKSQAHNLKRTREAADILRDALDSAIAGGDLQTLMAAKKVASAVMSTKWKE